MADEFDKLHKKLGADQLGNDEQKDLLNKFKQAGGEVQKPPRSTSSDTPRKSRYSAAELKKINESNNKKQSKSGGSSKGDGAKEKKTSKNEDQNQTSFFDRLSLYLNALFSGVINITSGSFKRSFINSTLNDLHSQMVSLDGVINFVLNPKKGDAKVFKGMMIQKDVQLYELLRLAKQLYRKEDFDLLTEKAGHSSASIDFFILEEPLRKIYRRIYLFRLHAGQIKSAVQLGLDSQMENNKLDKTTYDQQLSIAKQNIQFIFETFFYKLHYAFCEIVRENIFVSDTSKLVSLLQIQEQETVQYLLEQITQKHQENEREEMAVSTDEGSKSKADPESTEEELEELPVGLELGKNWIENLNFSKGKATEKDPKFYFDENDKIFKVYTIIEEFEKEFSFILTSNKIQFNSGVMDNKKLDTKSELSDLYLGINAAHDAIKDYIDIIKDMYKSEHDPTMMSRSRDEKIHKLSVNQTRISNIARTRLLDVVRTLERVLRWATEQRETVIQNNTEKLHFDSIDGKKRLEGKTAGEAVALCSSFAGYLKYLLERGELYGSSPLTRDSNS